MAEENKEVIEEITEEKVEQPVEEVVEEVDESKFESAGDPDVIKIDLSRPPADQTEEVEEEKTEEVVEEVKEETEEKQPEAVVEEITEEKTTEEPTSVTEEVVEEKQNSPENIQKLLDFMEETGGDLQDYVNLNRDISKMDNSDILDEYYRATKPHLSAEERGFLLEDTFGYNEDEDDAKTIRKKKIALKEQVAEAKAYLDGQKSKYYEEIKSGVKLTSEQQEAINFFNRYNKENQEQIKLSEASKKSFEQKTNNLFNDKFKGFEYNVGDKRFRFNVKDINKVKTTQSDLNNFINKFVGEDKSTIEDAAGYHKSLFTAMNPDVIAKHFYEQGMADAIKGQVAKDKNINTEPRKTYGEANVGGVKYRVLGDNANDFKFKVKRKKYQFKIN